MPVIEVEGLQKLYGDFPAVQGLSFQVGPGEVLGLVGPNGAGKTTTIRSIAGIIIPSAGTIRIAGHDLAQDPVRAKAALAFIPDEPHLFEYLTVEEHLRFVGRLYGVTDVNQRIPGLLEEMDLTEKRGSLPGELSRGMKQKLAIACGLLHEPQALLLDEPLTGLDPVGIRRMKATIMRRAAAGAAIMSELPPAPPGRGDLYPAARPSAGPGRGIRHHRRDHRAPSGSGVPKSGRCVSRPDRAGRGRRTVIRMFGYLAWRSAYNRIARQARHLRSPRYVAALLLGLAYLWFVVLAQRPTPASADLADPRWLELVGALALLGAVAWGWIFGVERRVLAFSPAEVTFLFSGPVSRRGLIQFKLLRTQLLILFNALLWTLILSRERFGVSPWLRVVSIWVLLTTLSFHRLGASFVRTSLAEHGRLGVRHRVVSLVVLGVVLVALTWSIGEALPRFADADARTPLGFLSALGEAAAQPLPTILTYPFRVMIRPLTAHSLSAWLQALWPALILLVLHYIWVVRSDTAFEEAAAAVSLQRAQAHSERRAGRPVRRAGGQSLSSLVSTGAPGLAGRGDSLEEPGGGDPDTAAEECGPRPRGWSGYRHGPVVPAGRDPGGNRRLVRCYLGRRHDGHRAAVGAQRPPGRSIEARYAPKLSATWRVGRNRRGRRVGPGIDCDPALAADDRVPRVPGQPIDGADPGRPHPAPGRGVRVSARH